jgi:hypothetical protein
VEYDGGLNRFGSFQQSALLGGAWNGHNADFSTTYSVQLMYKRFFKSYNYTNAYHSFQQAALVGGAWNGHNADFSTTYSVQLMYKQFFKSYGYTRNYASVQLTGVWSTTFAQKKCTFSGFIDFWRGEIADKGKLVILTEPQFWFNATPHLSVGTEVEISNNFVWNPVNDKSFFVNPTLALKWNF